MVNMLKQRQVYIITSKLSDKCYIGSTGHTLTHRLNRHRRLDCTSRILITLGEIEIKPLCIIENCSKKDIELKEREFQEQYKNNLVNISGIKKCKSPDYKKPWALDGRKKDYFNSKKVCSDCGAICSISSITNHKRSQRHLKALADSVHEPKILG
jgi:hypothetical protein